jgi:hypothetical protein
MKKGCLLLCGVAALAITTSRAVSFDANEFTGDLFGFYGSRTKGGADKSAFGYGGGLNYFLTQNWGAKADTYADAFEVPYNINFSGIFRYPLDERNLAPYALGGFGRQWEHAAQWTFHLGAGLEYRLTDKNGIFTEFRGVFPDQTKEYLLIQFGLRFRFW